MYLICVIMLGLFLGSFLNMLIYRLPRQEGIWGPRSHCPSCGKALGFADLIPVLGYVLLRGRCRYCEEKISIRYPLVEMSTALGLLIIYLLLGWGWQFVSIAILFLLVLPLVVIDWEHQLLPDQLTLSGLVLGLFLSVYGDHLTFFAAISGVLAGGGFLLLLGLVYPQGLGGGDIKFMAMVGSFVGLGYVLGAIFMGAILGLLFFGTLYIMGRVGRETPLPFGSFLGIGTFLSLAFGSQLLDWYLGLFI